MSTPKENMHVMFSGLAAARRGVYAYLSDAFTNPPSPKEAQRLSSTEFLDEAITLFSEAMAAALKQCAASVEDSHEWEGQAREEFMRLFKIPGAQYVMPYESVYRDNREIEGKRITGLLMGQSSVDVQKWYRLAALEISEEFKDLPDHIALELNYLAHLCMKEGEFAQADDGARLTRALEMERDFLAGHVVEWLGPLRDRILEKSRHPYFCAVAELAVDFTNGDLATLEDLLGPSGGEPVPRYEDVR